MSRRVLVIEDNPDNRELARYLLKAHGYECDTAPDGESGVRLAADRPPDIVLCDLQLPGMDGFEVLAKLREEPSLSRVPVVAVTAFAMVGDRDRILGAGFDAYMPKPIDPVRFASQVAAIAGWPAPTLVRQGA